MRCERRLPNDGQNQASTSMPPASSARGSGAPFAVTERVCHSCSKSAVNADATAGESTIAIRFSSRVHESSVQFADPLQTAVRSRTTYLWCMRSGMPGIAAVGTAIVSTVSGLVRGGGGTGIGPAWSTL